MKVRARKYKSGRKGWQIDLGLIHGKRVQLAFPTKAEADAELVRRKAELKREGHLASSLSYEERLLFVSLTERLAAVGATLAEAVEFFLTHAKPAKGEITVQALIDACLEAKAEAGNRARYLGQLKCSAISFARAGNGTRPASEIGAADVEQWLRSNEWAPKTWNVYLGDLRTVFQWGLEAGFVTINPCVGVARKKLVDGEIEFLSVDSSRFLLDRAAAWRTGSGRRDEMGVWREIDIERESFQDCLAFVVLGLFCGLRPERELGLMTWEDVKGDVVIVSGHRAKSRGRRIVDLPENAREWLRLCPVKEGRILPKNFTRKWKRLREACGLLGGWPHDGVRHTFATMHLAHHKDEGRLQMLMGHESAELIYKHYRGQVTPAEAAKFWALRPQLWGKALVMVDQG